MEKKKLMGLDSRTYEHPFDKKALQSLNSLKGFDVLTSHFLNWTFIKWHLIDLKGSNFHVTKESCPELFEQVMNVADILDLNRSDLPQIYTNWSYAINAYTTGMNDSTLLMLNSGAVDLLSKEQLDFIIGHEIGHIKSRHVIYHTLASFFANLISSYPIASGLITPIQVGLLYWNRMSELTADRAALLACQDEEVAIDTVIKMAGVPQKFFKNLNRRVFLEQAKEFESQLSEVESLMKNISVLDNSHPWTVLRAAELIKWVESGEYNRILSEYSAVKCPHCGSDIARNSELCPVCDRGI